MSGFVYFIQCQDRIKIGFSKSPRKRIGKLATDAPFPCTLLGVVSAAEHTEKSLHSRFAASRVHNEWFAATDELVGFIAAYASGIAAATDHLDPFRKFLKENRGRAVTLATDLGISPSAISQWQRVPAERALEIERITGVPRHELRPDIYPAPSQQESAA